MPYMFTGDGWHVNPAPAFLLFSAASIKSLGFSVGKSEGGTYNTSVFMFFPFRVYERECVCYMQLTWV